VVDEVVDEVVEVVEVDLLAEIELLILEKNVILVLETIINDLVLHLVNGLIVEIEIYKDQILLLNEHNLKNVILELLLGQAGVLDQLVK
jgi:hypothetical protein